MSPAALTSTLRPLPRVRFKNVLLATDFGSASAAAQAYAILLARVFGAHLYVLHVDEGPGVASRGTLAQASGSFEDTDFRKLEKIFGVAGIPFTFLAEPGEIKETLNRVAEENEIDVIVVGTHARHGLSYLLFGSVAETLGRTTTRPVITVGPKVNSGYERPLKKILYATDFSDEAKLALPYATSLAQEFRAELTVFHAAPAVERMVRDRTHIENCLTNRLKSLAPSSRFPWCNVSHVVRFGETTAQIVRQANAEQADLIVLGLHNAVRFTSHLPERLAYRVLCEARCPVLSILPSANELKAVHGAGDFLKKASSFN